MSLGKEAYSVASTVLENRRNIITKTISEMRKSLTELMTSKVTQAAAAGKMHVVIDFSELVDKAREIADSKVKNDLHKVLDGDLERRFTEEFQKILAQEELEFKTHSGAYTFQVSWQNICFSARG